MLRLVCEKEQVQALADAVDEMVTNLEQEFGLARHEDLKVDDEAMQVKEPAEPLFRVGAMGLGYDANRDKILLVAQEALAEEEEERDPREVRLFATRAQMQVVSSTCPRGDRQGPQPGPGRLAGRSALPPQRARRFLIHASETCWGLPVREAPFYLLGRMIDSMRFILKGPSMSEHAAAGQPNRLIHETSPYLLQHAYNPVDWYPWGPEALARAAAEDKPILLSVGYSACHWCHVMAHESFEDPETAALMNELFVNIKVDREERPDIDAIYMEAVQAMTGGGGWPMTVFLTPDGKPFYGGTYFPPVPRYNMPGFPQLLTAISEAWQNRRKELLVGRRAAGGCAQPDGADRRPRTRRWTRRCWSGRRPS